MLSPAPVLARGRPAPEPARSGGTGQARMRACDGHAQELDALAGWAWARMRMRTRVRGRRRAAGGRGTVRGIFLPLSRASD